MDFALDADGKKVVADRQNVFAELKMSNFAKVSFPISFCHCDNGPY